jgi:hypothetical protein
MLSWLLACLTIVATQAAPSYYVCTEKNIDYYGLEPLAFPTKWTKTSDSSYHPLCTPFNAHEFKDKPVWVGFYATCNFKSFDADSLKLTKVPSAHVKDPSIPLPIEQSSGIYEASTDHPYISKYIACVHRNVYTTTPPTSILSQYIKRIKKIKPTTPAVLLPTLKPEQKKKHVSFTLPSSYMRPITSKARIFTLQEKKKFKASRIPTLENLKLPQNHVPQNHVPKHHVPKHHVPKHHVPKHHVPKHHVPKHHVPQKHVPQKHVPKKLNRVSKKVKPTQKIHQKTKYDAFAVFRAKRLIRLHHVYKETQKQLQHIDSEIKRAKSFQQQYSIQKRKDRLNKLLLRVKKEYLDLY